MSARRVVSAVFAATLIVTGLVALPAAAAGPVAPTPLPASADASGTVHFEWLATPGASAYRVEWSTSPEFASGTVSYADTYALDYVTRWQPTPGADSDLYWRVTAFGSGITVGTLGDPSESGLITVGAQAAPQLLSPLDDDQIAYPDATVFSWQPVPGAISYQLEYSSGSVGDAATVVQKVDGTQFAPASPLARVDSGGSTLTWEWHVRAQFYNGTVNATPAVYGSWSTARHFQILWTEAPSNLYPADGTDPVISDLLFSWDAVPGAAKYRVTLGTAVENSGDTRSILNPLTRDVFTTTYIPTAQVSDSTRYWQVTPLDFAGNPGTPSPVHEYRKKWGGQDGPTGSETAPNAAPEPITGSIALVDAPSVYLTDFELEWQPLPRATFYQVEVYDSFANVYTCNTASTSVTIVSKYYEGLDNSGSGQVLQGSDDCLWETDANKRIQKDRTYRWRVRGVDVTGASTLALGTLPTAPQLSNFSDMRYVTVQADDRPAPTWYEVDLDLDGFGADNPPEKSGQAAPLLTWERSGQFVNDEWWPAPAYEVTFYKNPQRTAEIARVVTPSTRLRLNGVFDDNTTSNPYYATVRPVSPTVASWQGSYVALGGVDNYSIESFVWQKESKALALHAPETLTDGSVRLSWDPQSITGRNDGGSRGYQVRIFKGAVQQGATKKVEFPFFVAQKPGGAEGEFPTTPNDIPLPPGSDYTLEVAPLDANGNPGRLSRSDAFTVGIARPTPSDSATVAGSTALVQWSAVPGALKYSAQYRRVGTADWTAVTIATPASTVTSFAQTAAVIGKLDAGTYEWQVRTHDASNQVANVSAWTDAKQFTVGSGSVTLDTLSGQVLSATDRVVRWSSTVDGASRFQVQFADDANFSTGVKTYETVGTSYAIEHAIVSGKQYYWRVKALGEPVGTGTTLKVLGISPTRTFTARTIPAKTAGLKVVTSGKALTATWTPLSGAGTGTDVPITYVLSYREKSADADWSGAVETETSPSASSYTISGLTAGVTYEFRVAGKNTEGVGPWSDVREIASATVPLAVPTYTVTPKLGGVALSSITAPTGSSTGGTPITGYELKYRKSSLSTWTTVALPLGSSYTITGLLNGTSYEISLAAKNAVGVGSAAIKAATTLAVPSVPLSAVVTRGDRQATVTWAAPTTPNGTITGYEVQYRIGSTAAWTTAATVTGTTFKYVKTSLLNGTGYQFRVAAKTGTGTGAYTAPLSVTPAGKPIPSTTISATSSSTGTVTISWGKANANGSVVTGYIVKYSTNGTTWYTLKTVSGTTYKTTSTKGSHGKRVYFRLYAKNAIGVSTYKSVSVIRK